MRLEEMSHVRAELATGARWMLGVSLAVLLAGCSSSGHIDGPVLTSKRPPLLGGAGGMDAIVSGTVVFDDLSGCLLLESGDTRHPVVWPAGASWEPDPPSVRLKGQVIEPGMSVSGGGGYIHRDHVELSAGHPEVADAADACAGPTGDIAFFNIGSEVTVTTD